MEENTGAVAQRPEYSAFISYSHADASDVRKLHAKLEAYRLPRGLGRIDALNARKSGLGKVFRDREDLSAAENLSDAVTEALSRSQVLVVVCSPEARSSRWVNQEIEFFREHCPGRPILAAIVRGEPAEAFPAALTEGGTEPLAADLRKEGDGWKLGFLKVVAGIAGVPLDALVQRDSQREIRRVMAVTGVTALVAVAMGAMTMFAVQSRNDAVLAREQANERARETAELNSYFIGDFRDVLLQRSQLEVALEFYPKVYDYCLDSSENKLSDDEKANPCVQYMRILGTDLVSAGETEKALTFFELAFQLSLARLKAQPDDPDAAFDHYYSEGRLGFFHHTVGSYQKAANHFRKAVRLMERVRGSAIDRVEWLTHSSYAYASLAKSEARTNSGLSGALRDSARSVDLSVARLKSDPENPSALSDMAFHLQIMAGIQSRKGLAEAAFKSSATCLEIVDSLVADDPGNNFFQEQKMRTYFRHSEFAKALGKHDDAASFVATARRIQAKLRQLDETNQDYEL